VNRFVYYVCIMINITMKEWVEQLFEAWNSHDVTAVLEMYHDDFVREDLGNHKLYTKEELRKTVQAYITGLPDIRFVVEKMIGCENEVTVCWRAIGHHKGKIMNIPPTGKLINITGVSVIEVVNTRIKKVWYQWDQATMLRQMGLLPELRKAV
jgi:steroid delta-isomerase-like uncharacterized protein